MFQSTPVHGRQKRLKEVTPLTSEIIPLKGEVSNRGLFLMKPHFAPFHISSLSCAFAFAAIMAVSPTVVRADIWEKTAASVGGKPGNRSKASLNSVNNISKLADTADQAARNALASPPLNPMLLRTAATVEDDAPTTVAPDQPAVTPPLPIQFQAIPISGVPQKPAAPKRPERPVAPQSQSTSPPSPPSPRGSATQPLILPASATSPRTRVNAPARQHVLFPANIESWGYSGAIGPEFWGKLRPEWNLCAEGKRQSPVDFIEAKPVTVDLDPVKFDYRPASFVVINGSRQLLVKITEAMGMEVRGQRYVLEGFTLHRPAEMRIDNKIADMEAHFFHRDDKGRVAVLAVQFVRGGQPSAPLQTLLNNLPLEKGDSYLPQTTLDMAAFLPSGTAHYLYMGSLTTPPCTEGVLWVVMKEQMTLSDGQYEVFSHLHADNARPPQPAFDRLILESR